MEIASQPFIRATDDFEFNHTSTSAASVPDASHANNNLFFHESMQEPQDLKTSDPVKRDEQSTPLSIANLSTEQPKLASRKIASSEGSLSSKFTASSLSDFNPSTSSSSSSNAVNLSRPSLTYPSSSSDNQYQLQPRNGINPLQPTSVDSLSSQFQFPTSQPTSVDSLSSQFQFPTSQQQQQPQQQRASPFPNDLLSSHSHSSSTLGNFQYSQSSQFVATPTQQLPQLNFPTNNAQTSPSYFMNYNSVYPQASSHDLSYQSRSHSYGGDTYIPAAQNRRYNWSSLDQPASLDIQNSHISPAHQLSQRTEQFTQDDIHVLKSLLFNGEKVKWRYVSSKLSAITGRRATFTACSKKTRELFKLPSERVSGSLGTSLPYVVHNSWNSISEEETS